MKYHMPTQPIQLLFPSIFLKDLDHEFEFRRIGENVEGIGAAEVEQAVEAVEARADRWR